MYINVPRNIAMTPERNWMPLKFAMYSNSCHSSVRSSINSCDCKKKSQSCMGKQYWDLVKYKRTRMAYRNA